MRILLSATLCVCVMGLNAPEIARQSADRMAERVVSAAIAKAPGFHAGRVRSRDGARSIEIDDASAAGPGWRITAERLVLPGGGRPVPGFVTAAFARPPDAAAENVSVILGNTKVVIPHLDARGTDLTSQDLAAMLDPANAMTLADRLAKLTAAQISAPTIVLGSPRIPDPSTGDHLTLKAVSLTDVGSGRIAALSIASMAFASPQGAAMPVLFETGHIGIDGIDLPLALDMATGSRTEAAAALQAVVRSLSIAGIVVRPDSSTTIQVGSIQAGALRGRPLTLPPSDVMTLYGKAGDQTPADRQILSDLVADVVGSIAFDHLEVRDAVAKNSNGQQGSFKLGRATLDGFEVVKLGSFAVEDASFSDGATEMSLGRFVLGGYDGSGLVDVLKRQLGGEPGVTAAQVVPNRTSLALTDLHIAVPVTPRGTGAADPSKRVVVDIPVASMGGGLDAATSAVASRAMVEMVYDISAGASDPSYRDLIQYGLSRLDFGADYVASFNPAAKQINLDHLSFDAQNLGQLAMAAVLGNASLDMFQAGQSRDEALEAAQSLVFQSFTLVFVNTGVMEKIVPSLAASAKVSVPLFKAQMKAQAEININQVMGATPASARIIAAVKTFIDTPKSLTVVIKAPAGLSLATAAATTDPKALLGAVDIQVLANR